MKNFRRLILKLSKFFREKSFYKLAAILFFLLGLFLVSNYIHLQRTRLNQPQYGGVYREGVYEYVSNLNPFAPLNETERAILNIIYPSIFELDNGKIFSRLIKDYSFSPDKLTLKLVLKDNLKWSNGEEITTDDLLFSIELYRQYLPSETLFLKSVEFKVIDNMQFEIVMKNVDNYLPYKLTSVKIFPRKVFYDFDQENFKIDFLKTGSGPFVLEKISKIKDIQEIVLTRNEYFYPRPYLDKVVFYAYPSVKRSFDGLLLKEIDGLAGISYLEFPQNVYLSFQLNKIVLPRIVGLFFNSRKVDKKIVAYLNSVINREEIVSRVFNRQAESSESIFSPTVRRVFELGDFVSDIKVVESPSNLGNLKIEVLSSYLYPELARYLKDKFGFQIEFVEKVDLESRLATKDHVVVLMGIYYSWPPLLNYFWTSSGINVNNLSDVGLENLVQKLNSDSQVNFNQTLKEFERLVISYDANVFLVNPYYLFLLSKKIKNFDQFFLLSPESRFVKIEYWYRK